VIDLRETVFLYEIVLSSLQSVVARNLPPPIEWAKGSVEHAGFFDIAESHFRRAETHLQKQNEVGEAMVDLRKATEALLKAWMRQAAGTDHLPPDFDSLELDKLINQLGQRTTTPKPMTAILRAIQFATNPTAHDQGLLEESDFLTPRIAEGHMDGWRRLHQYAAKTLSSGRQSA